MAKRGRKIPEGEDREARDVQISIYVTAGERDELDRIANALGFRSKSALIASVIEPLVQDGFSGWGFLKLGRRFANLIAEKQPKLLDGGSFSIFNKTKLPDGPEHIL